jgi:hypothetical protein
VPKSKRKLKQQKRRAEKRAKLREHHEESSRSPAEELLARIAFERRIRHEQNSGEFRKEQERLWLAEERRRARQGRKGKG